MKIGVLALQGSFHEHIEALKKLNIETIQIKLRVIAEINFVFILQLF